MLPEFEKEAKIRMNTRGSSPSSHDEDLVINHQGYASSSVQAAKVFGVSGPTIQRAKRVHEQAPSRVADIIAGRATVGEVDEELREAKAEEHREQVREKETKTLPVQHPKAVKDYLVSCAVYRDSLELAIKCARADMFDPSAISIITTKHNAIRALMAEMEELV